LAQVIENLAVSVQPARLLVPLAGCEQSLHGAHGYLPLGFEQVIRVHALVTIGHGWGLPFFAERQS
jgi:hypothetical protein